MRVLHVYRTYLPDPPGGLQEAIRQIALAVSRFGFESRIFTLSPNPYPARVVRPEGDVIRCRSWAAPASCDIGGLAAFMRFRQASQWADVVHFHFPWPFADALRFLVDRAKPTVMTYHSDVIGKQLLGHLYAPLGRYMLSSMSAVAATSPAYVKSSQALSKLSGSGRVRVIPLGIDRESYPHAGDDRVIQRLGLREHEPFFLFLGVLRHYKGLKNLVYAAKSVGARIVIAGAGPEEGALRKLAGRAGAGNVVFAGQVSDREKVSLLKRCMALILPSHLRSEAFGMVLVEAAMFGKPMISCEIGTGTSYVNAHDETGLVVAPNSPDALVVAMDRMLSDPSLVSRMGRTAGERYEQLFSGPALGRAYVSLYRDVGGGP